MVKATINVFGYILRTTDTHIHITRDISDPYVGTRQAAAPVLLDSDGARRLLLQPRRTRIFDVPGGGIPFVVNRVLAIHLLNYLKPDFLWSRAVRCPCL